MSRFLAMFLVVTCLAATTRDLVIFDTDSGLFGDDGAALVMLLRGSSQEVLQGITIVPGNVWAAQGAEYMFHILDLLKKPQMQVAVGAEAPLIHTAAMSKEFDRRWGGLGYTGAFAQDPTAVVPAPGSKISTRKLRRDAINFLISEIERHPGEITILALGPMTNIALALRLKPDIETKIKRIVFMGGNIRVAGNATPAAEFNFWFDPEAARIVLRSRIPKKMMFGLDICNLAKIRKAEFDQIASARNPIAELFREDLGNRYPGFLKKPDAIGFMWDSLAAAYLLDPDFVTKTESRYLDVQTTWGQFYGSTTPLDRRATPTATPVTVMLDLDFKRVFALYKDRLVRSE
uniref:Inosine/uridine-preferring nucleoside hydrolase n=1 Tax=Solibacter usitatus (strain Ellin6076) TaxID=234267 RepID=Q029F1_SOLUE